MGLEALSNVAAMKDSSDFLRMWSTDLNFSTSAKKTWDLIQLRKDFAAYDTHDKLVGKLESEGKILLSQHSTKWK